MVVSQPARQSFSHLVSQSVTLSPSTPSDNGTQLLLLLPLLRLSSVFVRPADDDDDKLMLVGFYQLLLRAPVIKKAL